MKFHFVLLILFLFLFPVSLFSSLLFIVRIVYIILYSFLSFPFLAAGIQVRTTAC